MVGGVFAVDFGELLINFCVGWRIIKLVKIKFGIVILIIKLRLSLSRRHIDF